MNPAGQLHSVLVRYEAARKESAASGRRAVWEIALGKPTDMRLAMAELAELIPAIKRAALELEYRTGNGLALKYWDQYSTQWANPILFPKAAEGQQMASNDSIHATALHILELTASLLDSNLGTAMGIEADERKELTDQLQDLRRLVLDDPDLPVDLKAALAARLHNIEAALDNYDIRGPEAVASALEQILGAIALSYPEVPPAAQQGILKSIAEWAAGTSVKVERAATVVAASGTLIAAGINIGKALGA